MKLIDLAKRVLLGRNRYQEVKKKENQTLLQNNGVDALRKLFEVGQEENVEFSVFFGTLLGAYREHAFIKHDDDVDVAMEIRFLSPKLINALIKKGFIIHEIFVSSDLKGCQIPMKYKGLTTDIYVVYSGDNKNIIFTPFELKGYEWGFSKHLNIFRIGEVEFPKWDKMVKCKLKDLDVLVPDNAAEVLSCLYGKDFMTPKVGKKADSEDKIIPFYEKSFSRYPINFCIENNLFEVLKKSAK